ncbi:glycosyltransferase family 9 protein [Ramlibacter sp. MMS24-I3-19]|uniref:glycosyltransferase family 9 protein n=1 Tax=Ramlibacter sp. MMS24-I3-19 TaxID=3416606 RepID=UPI003D0181D1
MKRILVIATRQIGDVLLTTPVVRAARRRWPEAQIDVIGFAGTLGMLRGNPDIRRLIETPPRLGWSGFWRLARQLWRAYDLALIAQPGDRAHLMGLIAARQRSGILPAGHGSNWWKRRLLDHAVESGGDDSTVHVVREKLALLAPWMQETVDEAVVPPPAAPLPADIEKALQPDFVAVHAPSMWPYKQWPLESYAGLVRELLANRVQVVLTGSGGTRDQACIAPLRSLGAAPDLLDVSGRLDFNQLAGLLARAALYVGPDTSVSHLAASTGVPTMAVFGPTNPQRWAPWPATPVAAGYERRSLLQTAGNVTLLQAGLPCVPCGRAGCHDHNQSHSDCLAVITPARVVQVALEKLGR